MRKTILILGTLVLVAAVCLTPLAQTAAREIQEVLVTNWPSVFRVEGQVGIEGPVKLSTAIALDEALVTPVSPRDTTRLISGGVLETAGYSTIVLSLAGLTKSDVSQAGEVGAVLIPEIQVAENAFNEKGIYLFPLEVRADVGRTPPYFASGQPKYTIGFSRYRIYYFNTTNKAVTVNLYAYLTNS